MLLLPPREQKNGKNPKGDLRLDCFYFSLREQPKRRNRRVTYGWTVITIGETTKATKGKNPKGDLRLDRYFYNKSNKHKRTRRVIYGWAFFVSPHETDQIKEPEQGFTAGPSLCRPTRVTKGTRRLTYDRTLIFPSHESNTREEAEVTYD